MSYKGSMKDLIEWKLTKPPLGRYASGGKRRATVNKMSQKTFENVFIHRVVNTLFIYIYQEMEEKRDKISSFTHQNILCRLVFIT